MRYFYDVEIDPQLKDKIEITCCMPLCKRPLAYLFQQGKIFQWYCDFHGSVFHRDHEVQHIDVFNPPDLVITITKRETESA